MNKNNKEINKAEIRKSEQIQKRKRTQKILVTTSVSVIVVLSLVIILSMSGDPGDKIQNNENTSPSDIISQTEVSISMSDISTDAKFYSYDSDGTEIRYFTVIGSDGNVHVALDACDVCYHAKQGYVQDNDVMECRNCGLTFPINDIGENNNDGGCWPSRLPIKIEDGKVIIKISDLNAKKFMF